MMTLEEKEALALDLLRNVGKVIVAWTTGKDSAVMLHLAERAGVVHSLLFIDSGSEFPETYKMLEGMKQRHQIHVEMARMEDEPGGRACPCLVGKIAAINRALEVIDFPGQDKFLAVGIRRDEHEARASESCMSRRENPPHVRVHPVLNFTEADIWAYIHKYDVPVNPLYNQNYRSLGCVHCTGLPRGEAERSGRATEKEGVMAQLRERGYF